jgi:hypothetical protein
MSNATFNLNDNTKMIAVLSRPLMPKLNGEALKGYASHGRTFESRSESENDRDVLLLREMMVDRNHPKRSKLGQK